MADVKECCKNKDNLYQIPSEPYIWFCHVCGARHFEVDAEPLVVGVHVEPHPSIQGGGSTTPKRLWGEPGPRDI